VEQLASRPPFAAVQPRSTAAAAVPQKRLGQRAKPRASYCSQLDIHFCHYFPSLNAFRQALTNNLHHLAKIVSAIEGISSPTYLCLRQAFSPFRLIVFRDLQAFSCNSFAQTLPLSDSAPPLRCKSSTRLIDSAFQNLKGPFLN
jgi:hypothetical protein